MFQSFLLLLLIGLCLAGLTLFYAMSWDLRLNVETGAPTDVHFTLPNVPWGYFALFTGLVLAAFVLLLKRLLKAWKMRGRNAVG